MVALLAVVNQEILLYNEVIIHFWRDSVGLQFKVQLMVGVTLSLGPFLLILPSKFLLTHEFPFQVEKKMTATQTAAVMMGSPDLDVFFVKIELEAKDALCSQCVGWGGHWWNHVIWELGAVGHVGNCAYILRIPLI